MRPRSQSRTTCAIAASMLLAGYFLSTAMGLQSAGAQHGHATNHQAAVVDSWSRGDAFARALGAGMDKMHKEMMAPTPTGNADVDFLATMIPHHAGAVEMARLAVIEAVTKCVVAGCDYREMVLCDNFYTPRISPQVAWDLTKMVEAIEVDEDWFASV